MHSKIVCLHETTRRTKTVEFMMKATVLFASKQEYINIIWSQNAHSALGNVSPTIVDSVSTLIYVCVCLNVILSLPYCDTENAATYV